MQLLIFTFADNFIFNATHNERTERDKSTGKTVVEYALVLSDEKSFHSSIFFFLKLCALSTRQRYVIFT